MGSFSAFTHAGHLLTEHEPGAGLGGRGRPRIRVGSGLKLSAFPFTVATVVAFFVIGLPFLRRLALAFACGCGALVGLLISYGWWGYELATRWGSPLLPYLNQVFASPYAPLASNTDARRLPHGVLQALFYPFLWTQQPLRTSPSLSESSPCPLWKLVLCCSP